MTTTHDAIITAVITTLAGRSLREVDAMVAFQQLSQAIPDLTPDAIVAAADRAKALGSELRSLAWRVQQAEVRRTVTPR